MVNNAKMEENAPHVAIIGLGTIGLAIAEQVMEMLRGMLLLPWTQ